MFERESSLRKVTNLQSEEDEESNHQTEETHGFREGESENGVAKYNFDNRGILKSTHEKS